MNLKQHIRRILWEQSDRDLSPLIERYLKTSFIDSYKNLICDIKVKHPKNRNVLDGQMKYSSYSITVEFISGPNSKNWPRTMAFKDKVDKVLDDIWNNIYDMFNISVDVYIKYTDDCNK